MAPEINVPAQPLAPADHVKLAAKQMEIIERERRSGEQMLKRCITSLKGILKSADVPEDVLNEDNVRKAWEGSVYQDVGIFALYNEAQQFITLKEGVFIQSFENLFGSLINHKKFKAFTDTLEKLTEKQREDLEKQVAATRKVFCNNLMIGRQCSMWKTQVDPFTNKASLTFDNGIGTFVVPLPNLYAWDFNRNDNVVEDYKQHFKGFDKFIRAIAYSRFAPDRRRAFFWLHCDSDWGKGVLIAVLKLLGICASMSVPELQKILRGDPAGVSLMELLYAVVVVFDEWKHAASDLKMLNSTITVAPKNKARAEVEIFTKLFTSAEVNQGLTSDGVEPQFENRFSYLRPDTYSERIDDRPLFAEVSGAVYIDALAHYAATQISTIWGELRRMGKIEAGKVATRFLDDYHSEHLPSLTFGTLETSMDDLMRDFKEVCAAIAHCHANGIGFWKRDDLPKVLQRFNTDTLNQMNGYIKVGTIRSAKTNQSIGCLLVQRPSHQIGRFLDEMLGQGAPAQKLKYKTGDLSKSCNEWHDWSNSGNETAGEFQYYFTEYENGLVHVERRCGGIPIHIDAAWNVVSRQMVGN